MVLEDIPYSSLKEDTQSYEILLLRDVHTWSFSAIARQLGISSAQVTQRYNKIKVRQAHLYIRHIAIALGHQDTSQVREVFFSAMECYQNYAYACGYLEKTYPEMLQTYRAGEPGVPGEILEGLPPCPVYLGKEEVARIVTMREEGKATFRSIGRALGITPEKARHTYEMVYHRKVVDYMEQMQAQAGEEGGGWEIWLRYFGEHMSAKTRYERLLAEQGERNKEV